MKWIAVPCLCLLLAACAAAPKVTVTPPPRPQIPLPSPTALADCAAPVALRDGPATQQQVEAAWGADVDHLIDCGARHKILATYVHHVVSGLAGP